MICRWNSAVFCDGGVAHYLLNEVRFSAWPEKRAREVMEHSETAKSKPAVRSRRRRWLPWIIGVVLVLVALRIALPYAVRDYANRSLNRSRDYSGNIGDVNMRLWRGGYRIQEIRILRRSGTATTPLFSASQVDLSVDWRELLHGSVVGEVVMKSPHVNFISSTNGADNGKNEAWNQVLQSLFPFNLNRVEIDDGEIHFQNPNSTPPVDIYLSKLSATATNLTNARDLKEKLPSGLRASGSTIGGGLLTLQLQMNLLQSLPTYQLDCGLTNVDLVSLNEFLRAYGKFDVAHGRFAIYTSVASADGNYAGYIKVFFNNLDVFQWDKERKKNILKVFWEAIVAGVSEVFRNHVRDQLATKIPITGTYTNSSVGIWTATGTLLQNAFIRALVPKLDQPVTVDQVEKSGETP
jgi:hypothetical protein